MAVKWKTSQYPGVRFYEHDTRRHGVQKDKYFAIRYYLDGKRKEEGLGWSSQGWSVQKAAEHLAELRKAARTGEGERTLAEKRAKAEAKRKAEEAARAAKERESITFAQFFEDTYFPQAKADKTPRSWKREEQFARLWIFPVVGNKPLSKVSPMDLERIKKNMADAGRAPRSIQYCLATIRQVFNQARRLDLYSGDNPVSKVKTPSLDNRRLRFLTEDEAQRLLEHLHAVSPQVHDMALLSLHCGLRAGEIFSLTWGDVDLKNELLTLRDTKSGKSRAAYMTAEVRTMFEQLGSGENSDLVFPARGGIKINQISATFDRVVESIGLNNGVTDKRLRVCFHSLRHTYASWLVMRGVDLFTVKEMLGHSSLSMTERYSHLSPHTFRKAAKELEGTLSAKPKDKAKVVNLHNSGER
jgi:integrase